MICPRTPCICIYIYMYRIYVELLQTITYIVVVYTCNNLSTLRTVRGMGKDRCSRKCGDQLITSLAEDEDGGGLSSLMPSSGDDDSADGHQTRAEKQRAASCQCSCAPTRDRIEPWRSSRTYLRARLCVLPAVRPEQRVIDSPQSKPSKTLREKKNICIHFFPRQKIPYRR